MVRTVMKVICITKNNGYQVFLTYCSNIPSNAKFNRIIFERKPKVSKRNYKIKII